MWGSSRRRVRSLVRDDQGAVAVEFGLVGGTFILILMGILDLGGAYWQWNEATKALQLGVRLASVSDPVSSDLKTLDGVSLGASPGDPMPYFERKCSGQTTSCTNGTYDVAAMNTLVYGRGQTSCPAAAQSFPAMCQIFARVQPRNLVVEYVQTGLGFAGRPGGPVPTITLRLTGLDYNFVVLNGLLGLPPIPMSGLSATATAEDMSGR